MDKKFLKELFDSKPYEWEKNLGNEYGEEDWIYSFDMLGEVIGTDLRGNKVSEANVIVIFTYVNESTPFWTVSLMIQNEFSKHINLNLDVNLKFWATIKDIFKDFMNQVHPIRVRFSSFVPELNNVYDKFIKVISKEYPNYKTITKHKDDDYDDESGRVNTYGYYYLIRRSPSNESINFLKEILDTPMEWTLADGSDEVSYSFVIKNDKKNSDGSFSLDDKKVKVLFDRYKFKDYSSWSAEFVVDGDYIKSSDLNPKLILPFWSTIKQIFIDFMKRHNPDHLEFFAFSPQLTPLYNKFAESFRQLFPDYSVESKEETILGVTKGVYDIKRKGLEIKNENPEVSKRG